ncbi:hypothetical protein OKW32_000933 [Paraburkholderia youngii]
MMAPALMTRGRKHTNRSDEQQRAFLRIRPLPIPILALRRQRALIRCANFWRNFATFGATTNEQ